MSHLGFYETKEYKNPIALKKEQIIEMRDHVNFQSHTLFHPMLPKCNKSRAWEEINQSKMVLENEFDLYINSIAFPSGKYSQREIQFCKKSRYESALTVDPGFNTFKTDLFKLKRLNMNDTSDLNELEVRASGLWAFIVKRLLSQLNF